MLGRDLQMKVGPATEQLGHRTVRSVYGTLHTIFDDAVAAEMIAVSPCSLKKGDLPKKIDKDPEWRAGAIFSRDEVEVLISDERIPPDRRVLNAILVVAGLRFGEAAALRWRNHDATVTPLGRLTIAHSFDMKTKRVKEVKTGVPRLVPVHPTLATVLDAWHRRGWEEMMGRAPSPGDLVIPPRPDATDEEHRNVNRALRRFHEDLDRVGLRRRRQHDLRRTFVTLLRVDGARVDILEQVSHGPRGTIVDMYTTLPWPTLCEEIRKLRIELRAEGEPASVPSVS